MCVVCFNHGERNAELHVGVLRDEDQGLHACLEGTNLGLVDRHAGRQGVDLGLQVDTELLHVVFNGAFGILVSVQQVDCFPEFLDLAIDLVDFHVDSFQVQLDRLNLLVNHINLILEDFPDEINKFNDLIAIVKEIIYLLLEGGDLFLEVGAELRNLGSMFGQRSVHINLPGFIALETIQVSILEIGEAGRVHTALEGAQKDILHRHYVGVRRLIEDVVGRFDGCGRRLAFKGLIDLIDGIQGGLDAGLERRDHLVRQGCDSLGVVSRMFFDRRDGRLARRYSGSRVSLRLCVLLRRTFVGLAEGIDGVFVGGQLEAKGLEGEILRSRQFLPVRHGFVSHGFEGRDGCQEFRRGRLGLDGVIKGRIRLDQLVRGVVQPIADRGQFRGNFFGIHVTRGLHGLDLGLQGCYLVVAAFEVLQLLLGLKGLDVGLQVVVAGGQSEQSGNGRYGHAFNCDSHDGY